MATSCDEIEAKIDALCLIIDELTEAECKGTDVSEGGDSHTRSVRYTNTLRALDLMYKRYDKLGCGNPLYELRQEVIVTKPCRAYLDRPYRYRV